MSITFDGNTYRASSTEVVRDAGDNSDQVKGYFSVFHTSNAANPIKIAPGSTVVIEVDQIQNPASTQNTSKNDWKVYLNYRSSSTYESREDTSTGIVNSGLSTCVSTSTQGSASAVIGSDRIGSENGIWRFKFTTSNIWSSQASFRVTLPDSISSISTTAYDFRCNTGCTASSNSITPTKSGQALTFPNAFSSSELPGTVVDITIGNWRNPPTESVLDVFYEIIWVDSGANTWQIEKFHNQGELTGAQTIYGSLSSNYDNTYIQITDAATRGTTDCRIRPPQAYLAR